MIFDRSKVIDGLCDNLEQWIGWKGYLSDRMVGLKNIVEEEKEDLCKVVRIRYGDAYPFDTGNYGWQFFYPVEPPKEKEELKLVPFATTKKFLDWYCAKYNWSLRGLSYPMIWLKDKASGNVVFIDKFVFESSAGSDGMVVSAGGCVYSMESLLDLFTLLDGTPIGKEEE